MANVVVVGAQWGDEGKGKIVDWLSERADIVVRYQGGHNAGHTLVIGNETYKLSLLPSGVVRPGKLGIIGNGVVVDPWALGEEIARLEKQGVKINRDNLRIAENATLILPLAPRARPDARGCRRRGQDRHDRSRHRPGLRGQGRPPRHSRTGSEKPRHPRAQGRPHPGPSQRAAARPRPAAGLERDADGAADRGGADDPALHGCHLGPSRPRPQGRQAHPVRRRARGAARRRPRHLPVRHLVEHGRRPGRNRLRRRPRRARPHPRHRQGLHHPRRLRPVPDRAHRRHRRAARQEGPRIRRRDRAASAAAAGSMPAWCARPSRSPASTASR